MRELFSRKWWWVTLVVLALMAVLARLGIWQLDRLEERRAANAVLIAALDSPPIDLNQPAERELAASDPVGHENRDVVVRGRYDYDNQKILILQNYQERPGVNLITPLVLDDGRTAVLVDRGWIPDAEAQAGNWQAYEGPAGESTVVGYAALTQTLRRAAGSVQTPTTEIYRVDVEAIQADLPYDLLPFYIREAPAEGGDAAAPFRTAREVDLSEGPHLGYALQWFVFSLGLGVAYAIFVSRQSAAATG